MSRTRQDVINDLRTPLQATPSPVDPDYIKLCAKLEVVAEALAIILAETRGRKL